MRIYFSGNAGNYPPEVLMAERPPHIMLSFFFVSQKQNDKGTKKRLRILFKGKRGYQ